MQLSLAELKSAALTTRPNSLVVEYKFSYLAEY